MCSLSGCDPAVLLGPQGETGVEGGVNGLNPGVGFLSQALWREETREVRTRQTSPWRRQG